MRALSLGNFIHGAELSVAGCSERFLVHVPTLGMTSAEVEEWAESYKHEREKSEEEMKALAGTTTTRPLLKRELLWHMSQEEFDRLESQDRQRLVAEEKRLISLGDKTRRKYKEQERLTRQEEKEQEVIYEQRLANEYRKQRLTRLSDEVRREIDLDTQFRDRVHV